MYHSQMTKKSKKVGNLEKSQKKKKHFIYKREKIRITVDFSF